MIRCKKNPPMDRRATGDETPSAGLLAAFLVALRTPFVGPAINPVDPERVSFIAGAVDLQKRSDRGI
jgi:hypothetical protein